MINAQNNGVAWSLLVMSLDETREHLEDLVNKMSQDGEIDENDYAVELGHIYAHLNRAWHSRNHTGETQTGQWAAFNSFPQDLSPVG